MMDRGIIKWQPFNSCFESLKIINDISKEKNKIIFPTLSEDQLKIIEEKIRDAYYLKSIIQLEYFYDGKIIKLTGKISYIFWQEKKICIGNKIIYFKQILNVYY